MNSLLSGLKLVNKNKYQKETHMKYALITIALIGSLFLAKAHAINLQCGLAPIPPIGCYAQCVCEGYLGVDCHWEFICR